MFGSTVPALLVAQASAMQLVEKATVGGWLPAGSTIVIGGRVKTAEVTFHSSRTVNVGVYVPGVV